MGVKITLKDANTSARDSKFKMYQLHLLRACSCLGLNKRMWQRIYGEEGKMDLNDEAGK